MDERHVLETVRKVLENEAGAITRIAGRLDRTVVEAVEMILNSPGRLIVSGMGKSGLVGRKISATLSSTGTPSIFLHPAEALHGDLGTVTGKDVVLLMSNSGETEEIVRLLPFLRRIGAKIIAMVGNPGSTLARTADIALDTSIEREACPMNLAPTSSTTVTIALGDALAVALLDARGFEEKDFARLHPSGSLGRRFLTVRDLMHSGGRIPFASPGLSLKEGILKMSRGGFGALVVADGEGKLLGILTDGDLRRYFERSDGSLAVTLDEVMVRSPKRISPDRLAMEALKIMEEKSITSLPVVENEIVTGFLHIHDILKSKLV